MSNTDRPAATPDQAETIPAPAACSDAVSLTRAKVIARNRCDRTPVACNLVLSGAPATLADIAALVATDRAYDKPRAPVTAWCQECGHGFRTVKAAEKAMSCGCPRCGAADIDVRKPVAA